MVPLACQLFSGVGRVDNNIVAVAALGSSLALTLNLDECLDEAVHLGLRLRLRWLNHQGLVYGEREGRSVEAVVHKAVCDVAAVDVVVVLEACEVENHLVTYAASLARVVCAVLVLQG